MPPLQPRNGAPRLQLLPGLPQTSLNRYDAVLLLTPEKSPPGRALPDASRWQALHRRGAANHGTVRTATLDNSRQTLGRARLLPQGYRRLRTAARRRPAGTARIAGTTTPATHRCHCPDHGHRPRRLAGSAVRRPGGALLPDAQREAQSRRTTPGSGRRHHWRIEARPAPRRLPPSRPPISSGTSRPCRPTCWTRPVIVGCWARCHGVMA